MRSVLIDGRLQAHIIDELFDYVIVGSGAAGATAARVLIDTGASVAVIEEGPAVVTKEFGDKLFPALRTMFRDMGSVMARGRSFIPVLQGVCLGGSTVVNSAIFWRIPDAVCDSWSDHHDLGTALPLDALNRHWDLIEKELSVASTPPHLWGDSSTLIHEAGARLSIGGLATSRSVDGCRGSARCLTGCPHGAKQSMLVSYLPYAEKRGASLFSSARVDRVRFKGGLATAVDGQFKNGVAFTVKARKAILIAASAIQTPGLLRRSGVRSPHLGEHFQGHPGCAIVGVFDRPVNPWSGATQGYELDGYCFDQSYEIEAISLPPEMILSRLPGIGTDWVRNMAQADHVAVLAVQLRSNAQGSVREGSLGLDIRYNLTKQDMVNLRRSLRCAADILFAAGAQAVLPGIHGMPTRLTSPDQTRLLELGPSDPSAYAFVLSHLFSTARMSRRPSDGVVATDFSVHGTRGLYVIDSSVFPTNLGVNPQLAIMGVAMHAANQLADRN